MSNNRDAKKRRDELAKNHTRPLDFRSFNQELNVAVDNGLVASFQSGWDACESYYKELASSGFNNEAHMRWLTQERENGLEPSPQANARWQFKRDQVTLTAMRAEIGRLTKYTIPGYKEIQKEMEAEITRLVLALNKKDE